jgi:hypothetical protein
MSATPSDDLSPAERSEDFALILNEMRHAVQEAVRQHKRAGNPIAIWRDGRVVWLQPEEIPDLADP